MEDQNVSVSNDVPDEVVEQVSRLLFDKSYPDVPDTSSTLNRDQWFAETHDYWKRAAREVAELLGTSMIVKCPCGYEASGPAEKVRQTVFMHRCEKTDPTWNKRGNGWIG